MLQTFEIHYIGRTKERRPGEWSALGYVNGDWRVIFPEHVLRKWFMMEDPAGEKNLYAILGAKQDATADEIKSSFRRLAMQWHPDKNNEPNAHEVFIRIQEAYNILNDPTMRAKYDVGLALQQRCSSSTAETNPSYGFRTPLRCGMLLVNGIQSKRWFIVDEICAWLDIINPRGETLVSSWVYGEDKPTERWITA